MTSTGVLSIIISKLGHWREPSPVVLLEVDKGLEIRLYGAVLLLGLPVCLRMEGGRKPFLDAKKVAERWPEFRGEKGASIGHNQVE